MHIFHKIEVEVTETDVVNCVRYLKKEMITWCFFDLHKINKLLFQEIFQFYSIEIILNGCI